MSPDEAQAALELLNKSDPMEMFGGVIGGRDYKAEGFVYRDIRWAKPEGWAKIKEIIGDGNYVVLVETIDKVRGRAGGQLLISPEGMKRSQEWAKAQAN